MSGLISDDRMKMKKNRKICHFKALHLGAVTVTNLLQITTKITAFQKRQSVASASEENKRLFSLQWVPSCLKIRFFTKRKIRNRQQGTSN